ncbi:MAG: glutamine amidotransferase, partial [Actinobacteria bacterium]|nr:glutamine amidotransferase [Actinomycetota bacterium]
MTISIVRLYHDLMGTYGDQGNAEVLMHRAKARG